MSDEPRRIVLAESPDGLWELTSTRAMNIGAPAEQAPAYDLVLQDRPGGSHRALVGSPSVQSAGFSPDSSRFAYATTSGGVCFATVKDAAPHCVLGQGGVAWSPDGSSAAYERSTGPDETNLFITQLDSRQTVQLTRRTGFNSRPSFSPDGRTVVFVASPAGLASLCAVELASGEVVQLTNQGLKPGPALRQAVPLPEGPEGLVWAPDGRVAWRGDGQVWVLNPATPAARPVAPAAGRIRLFSGSYLEIDTKYGPRQIAIVEE